MTRMPHLPTTADHPAIAVLPEFPTRDQIEAFGQAHPDFVPLPVAPELERLKVADATQLCTADGQHLRLWPHRHGTDGFFATVWVRK